MPSATSCGPAFDQARLLRAVGERLPRDLGVVRFVRLAEVRGVGVGDRALRAHPVHGGAGVEAAREGDAHLLAPGQRAENRRQADALRKWQMIRRMAVMRIPAARSPPCSARLPVRAPAGRRRGAVHRAARDRETRARLAARVHRHHRTCLPAPDRGVGIADAGLEQDPDLCAVGRRRAAFHAGRPGRHQTLHDPGDAEGAGAPAGFAGAVQHRMSGIRCRTWARSWRRRT